MQFDKGFISAYFVTDPDRMETVLEDARILLVQGKISSVQELLPLLEKVVQAGKPLLIVAEDVDGEALSTLVVNRIRGTFSSCAVKAPGLRRSSQGDPAGPRDPHRRPGRRRPRSASSSTRSASRCSARARRVVVTKDNTTIVDGGGDPADVEARIAPDPRRDRAHRLRLGQEKLQERLAKIAGGVVVIKVGGHTEVELKEKKHRIEDAVSATRAAIEEGIVAGGGTALVQAAKVLEGDLGLDGRPGHGRRHRPPLDVRAAALDRRERRRAGLRRRRPRSPSCRPVMASTRPPASTATSIAAGVIDPVKVTRSALQNAASIAAMLLTTEALVVEKKEEEPEAGWSRPRPPRPLALVTRTPSKREGLDAKRSGPSSFVAAECCSASAGCSDSGSRQSEQSARRRARSRRHALATRGRSPRARPRRGRPRRRTARARPARAAAHSAMTGHRRRWPSPPAPGRRGPRRAHPRGGRTGGILAPAGALHLPVPEVSVGTGEPGHVSHREPFLTWRFSVVDPTLQIAS